MTEMSSKNRGKRQSQLKKEVFWLKRSVRRGKKGETGSSSSPRLCGMTSFMHSSCVCQSRPGVFVGQFLREKKKGREKNNKVRKGREERKRVETLNSNSREWIDPDRKRLCSLCGFSGTRRRN